jgi:hypothetical protein
VGESWTHLSCDSPEQRDLSILLLPQSVFQKSRFFVVLVLVLLFDFDPFFEDKDENEDRVVRKPKSSLRLAEN